MGAGSLCGHHVLRSGLDPADCGTEGDESNGGFPDSEPGIQYFSSGRMGDFRAKAFFQGSTGLRPHVWRHHTGADSGGTPQGSISEYGGKLEGPVQKENGVTEGSQSETSQSETSQSETSQ